VICFVYLSVFVCIDILNALELIAVSGETRPTAQLKTFHISGQLRNFCVAVQKVTGIPWDGGASFSCRRGAVG
jgi:hypothetical protein